MTDTETSAAQALRDEEKKKIPQGGTGAENKVILPTETGNFTRSCLRNVANFSMPVEAIILTGSPVRRRGSQVEAELHRGRFTPPRSHDEFAEQQVRQIPGDRPPPRR
jgi:hypothetical protein